jgi:hypothetical protein
MIFNAFLVNVFASVVIDTYNRLKDQAHVGLQPMMAALRST